MTRKYKVLIVDDSAVVRDTLKSILSADPHLEVIATAQDPYVAVERIRTEVPDVITLDVEMPRMDGLTFLQKIMSQRPIPVVMCSSLTETGCETTLRALEYGAVDIITKPKMGTKQFLEDSATEICDAVRGAAMARVRKMSAAQLVQPKLSADAVLSKPVARTTFQTTEKVIVIGASTGGTEALRVVLQAMPMDAPGIVIVQHMPEKFTAAFAKRLDTICAMTIKEAEHNDTVVRGRALIAPGNRHMMLMRSGARYYVEINDGPLVSRHRPSVDVLFRSAAKWAGPNVVSAILTGMGDDGATGMLEMKETGGKTIAQDEASCVVFGMPNEAIKRGGVDQILPLDRIAYELLRLAR